MGDGAECGVVMEPSPGTALEVVEPKLLFHFLVITFDTPAKLDERHQALERGGFGKVGEEEFKWAFGIAGAFDDQPDRLCLGSLFFGVTLGGVDANGIEPSAHLASAAVSPGDGTKLCRGYFLDKGTQ